MTFRTAGSWCGSCSPTAPPGASHRFACRRLTELERRNEALAACQKALDRDKTEAALAAQVGTRWTLVVSGVLCVAGSVWFASKLKQIRTILRPVYVRLGILPEAALGVQEATVAQSPEAS